MSLFWTTAVIAIVINLTILLVFQPNIKEAEVTLIQLFVFGATMVALQASLVSFGTFTPEHTTEYQITKIKDGEIHAVSEDGEVITVKLSKTDYESEHKTLLVQSGKIKFLTLDDNHKVYKTK